MAFATIGVNGISREVIRVSVLEIADAQREEIAALCQRRKARRLTRLHEPVRPGSAAAFLVEFLQSDIPPLTELAVFENEVANVIGRPTDLHLYIRGFYLGNIPDAGEIVYDRALHMEFPVPNDKIAMFCQQHKIVCLAKLRRPIRSSVINDADVDFIAEFAHDARLGFEYFGMDEILTKLLGYPADLRAVDSIAEWQKKAKESGQSAAVVYGRPH